MSMRARGSVDTQIPLRDYFLWVGGALLVLLFAANSLLPAPLPSKLIESHSTLPPIRITSDLKGPEAVVIDTSQPGFLPMLPDKEIAAAPSPLSWMIKHPTLVRWMFRSLIRRPRARVPGRC